MNFNEKLKAVGCGLLVGGLWGIYKIDGLLIGAGIALIVTV